MHKVQTDIDAMITRCTDESLKYNTAAVITLLENPVEVGMDVLPDYATVSVARSRLLGALPRLTAQLQTMSNYLNEYPLLILYVLKIALPPPQHPPHISVSADNAIVLIVHELSFASLLLILSHSHRSHHSTQLMTISAASATAYSHRTDLFRTRCRLVRSDTNTLKNAANPLYLGPPVRVIRDFLSSWSNLAALRH